MERVRSALEADPPDQQRDVARMADAEELHQFVLNYDVTGGLAPVRAVIDHARCDAGTALYLYWLCAADYLLDPSLTRRAREEEFDYPGFAAEVKQRLLDGRFTSAEIHFDPAEEFTAVQQHKLRKAGAGDLLSPVGSRRIEQIWL